MRTERSLEATCVCHLSNRHSLPPRHVTQDGEYSKSCKEAGAAVSNCDNDGVPEIRENFHLNIIFRLDCMRHNDAAALPDDVVVELIVRRHRKQPSNPYA